MKQHTLFSDPVAAYDRIAPHYDDLAAARRQYLQGVEDLVVSRVPTGSKSLLDVGAGDAKRARRIASESGLQTLVLLEPSAGMRGNLSGAEMWAMRAEEVDGLRAPAAGRFFDVITCLWNVLGHIRPESSRIAVLSVLRELLSEDGILFLDVNHRYNVRSYGTARTALRFLRDRLKPGECNGDVKLSWELDGESCRTYGHVFTEREMRRITQAAGLKIEERMIVDYDNGQLCRHAFQGNLLYVLCPRNRASEPSRASQTSSISTTES